MQILYQCVLLMLFSIANVEAKYCWYKNTDGEPQFYYCSGYEHCCNQTCCDNFMSFYRLWYFWFCVLCVLIFCSGGGYWYKKRQIRHHIVLDHPYNLNTTTVLTVSNNRSANQRSSTNAGSTTSQIRTTSTWDPYSNVPRPVYPRTVSVNAAPVVSSAYFPPPPAYTSVVSHTDATHQPPIGGLGVALPPSYSSVVNVAPTANQNHRDK